MCDLLRKAPQLTLCISTVSLVQIHEKMNPENEGKKKL